MNRTITLTMFLVGLTLAACSRNNRANLLGPALDDTQPDQSQSDASAIVQNGFAENGLMAQSFKPTASVLTRVEVGFHMIEEKGRVEIRTNNGGKPSTETLATAGLVNVKDQARLAEGTFLPPLTLAPGTTYWIVFYPLAAKNTAVSYGAAVTTDKYPAGTALYTNNGGDLWTDTLQDCAFTTFR